MQPEPAIVVRFPRLEVPLTGLMRSHPFIADFSQLNMGVKNADARALQGAALREGGGDSLPRNRDGSEITHIEPERRYDIAHTVFIIDCSGSMSGAISPSFPESKLEHVKRKIREIVDKSLQPGSKVSVVIFHTDATKIYSGDLTQRKALERAIATINLGGSTFLNNALKITRQLFAIESLRSNGLARNAAVIMTDGHDDSGSMAECPHIARDIMATNGGVYLIGAGTEYADIYMRSLSGDFGYSGMDHTPHPNDNELFDLQLPGFFGDMQTADHYVDLEVAGTFARLHGVTPSIRVARGKKITMGYQLEGMGAGFELRDDLNVTMVLKRAALDNEPVRRRVPIVDFEDLPPNDERGKRAQSALDNVLLYLAQSSGELRALHTLRQMRPEWRPMIDRLIEMKRLAPGDQDTRLETLAAMAGLGSMTGRDSYTRRTGKAGGEAPKGRPNQSLGNHSGALGPLSLAPGGSLRSFAQGAAGAYELVVPVTHDALVYSASGIVSAEYSLKGLDAGATVRIGRETGCWIQLADSQSSRVHAKISKIAGGYVVADADSTNGTYANGVEVAEGGRTLADGDVLTFTHQSPLEKLTFRAAVPGGKP